MIRSRAVHHLQTKVHKVRLRASLTTRKDTEPSADFSMGHQLLYRQNCREEAQTRQNSLLAQTCFPRTYTLFSGSLSSSEHLHQSSKAKRRRMTTRKSHIHFTGLFQTSWRFKKVSMEPWMLVAGSSGGCGHEDKKTCLQIQSKPPPGSKIKASLNKNPKSLLGADAGQWLGRRHRQHGAHAITAACC